MKTIRRVFCLLLVTVFMLSFTPVRARAEEDKDHIHEYVVTVTPRADGTLDINYHIRWEAVDPSEPLEWVLVGIPNKHVDTITPKNSFIKKARYVSENGSYVRIDFDRGFKNGEIVEFEFSIHQSWMSFKTTENLDKSEKEILKYTFVPGWFDEIVVDHCVVKWNKALFPVLASDTNKLDGDYLIWEKSLEKGERMTCTIEYSTTTFPYNEDEAYYDDHESENSEVLFWIIVIIVVVLVLALVIVAIDDGYGGGFGGGGVYYRSSCASSCACASCACACACAGGGRAGCSKKGMYNGRSLNRPEPDKPDNLLDTINCAFDKVKL